MSGPRWTAAQKTGQVAEAAFAKSAVEAGMLWHPTSAGSDLGIDGKVEIVEAGIVRGPEFNVQIKGTSIGGAIGDSISLGQIKVSTLSYWGSKVLPTLLVVHHESTDRLYYGWFHDVVNPKEIVEYRRQGRHKVRLSMPAKRLKRRSWIHIKKTASSAHEALNSALEQSPVRSYVQIIYCLTAEVTDVLVDVVTSIAYSFPPALALQFAAARDLSSEELIEVGVRFAAEVPVAPEATLHTASELILTQLVALDHELQAFLFGKFMFEGENNPVVRFTEAVQARLHELVGEIQLETLGPEPEGDSITWRVMKVDWVRLICGMGFALILLRDYQRELRPLLLPMWGRIEWPAPKDGDHTPLSTTRLIRDLSDHLVTKYESRRPDTSRADRIE